MGANGTSPSKQTASCISFIFALSCTSAFAISWMESLPKRVFDESWMPWSRSLAERRIAKTESPPRRVKLCDRFKVAKSFRSKRARRSTKYLPLSEKSWISDLTQSFATRISAFQSPPATKMTIANKSTSYDNHIYSYLHFDQICPTPSHLKKKIWQTIRKTLGPFQPASIELPWPISVDPASPWD